MSVTPSPLLTPAPLIERLALSTGGAPIEESFERAASRGLQWLELACQEPINLPHTFDAERTRSLRSLIDSTGIRGVVHSASSVNAAEIIPGVRTAVEDYLHSYIRLADSLGAETVIVHGGFYFDLDLAERLDALRMTLESCTVLAERLGITLAVENMNVLPEYAEIRYLGCTEDEVAAIIETIDSASLTSCVDLGHAHLLPGGADAFIDRFAGRIGHVQLTDNDGVIDHHLALGEGNLDVLSALAHLDAAGYTGPVALELSNFDAQDRSIAELKRLGALPA